MTATALAGPDPEPEIVEAARQMGVDPAALRRQLDAADLTPPTAAQTDDLPKLLARLAEPDRAVVLDAAHRAGCGVCQSGAGTFRR